MTTSQILQYVITGITLGSIYALIAIGFVTIYNVTGILNFAQGEFVMLGGMLMISLTKTHIPMLAAFIATVLVVTLVGAAVERLAIRPARGASVLAYIIITLAASMGIRAVALLAWGTDPFSLPPFSGDDPIFIMGATMLPQHAWILGTTVVLVLCLFFFFERTLVGKALRACAMNRNAARLMGISTDRMSLVSFALSAALGAVGGIVLAPVTMMSYDVGLMFGLKGFIAGIIGGMHSFIAAIIGGLLLGVLESVSAGMISSGAKDAITFGVLIVMLFLQAKGLFAGHAEGESGL